MRWILLPVALIVSTTSFAQTTSVDPDQSRQTVNNEAVETVERSIASDRVTTFAGGNRTGNAQVSKNEAYNLGRAASGRLGVRLGNDMSFPLGK